MNKNKIILYLVIILTTLVGTVNAQLLENSLFRIYRAEFILGTVTQLRFDKDSSYSMEIIEIHCSLCDHDKLRNSINKTGKWVQKKDTIILDNNKKLRVIQDTIRPLFLIGSDTDNILNEKQEIITQRMIDNNLNDFHLIYDTYPNGVARIIVDRYRMRKDEYEIEFKPSGTIRDLRYYWDNKQRKRIK
ncbi:MAG: hypothetical protein U5Q03_07910 [Bacteroidota bacterium]|nr:hypothetical protein [Bacteroidota bacterium]